MNSLKLELEEVVSHMTWVLKTELSPLEEMQVLLTSEPKIRNFKLHVFLFIVYMRMHACTHVIVCTWKSER